jgi:dTDP-4-dehydrorhamnose reductase
MINKKILLIGGSGNLGSCIKKSKIFKKLISPKRKSLNLLNKKKIGQILSKNKFDLIINCASMARMKMCEKDVSQAINNNILGTFNLVNEIIKYEKKSKKKIKLIHISSDAVYPSLKGGYNENSNLGPYNNYGWTKLSSEFLVRMLEKYIIIRTRFYNNEKINYRFSASDIFTSQLEINLIPRYIGYLIKENYNGIINVGGKKISDYALYKKIKPNLKPFKRKNLVKKLNFQIAFDASLNSNKFKKIKKKYE